VNVRGTFAGAREAARRMGAGGVIVDLASTTGLRGAVGISGYSTSTRG
jgi:NAD(P)-dependent dehydrogenase (short-subunit alcohol dehydrogenase family)